MGRGDFLILLNVLVRLTNLVKWVSVEIVNQDGKSSLLSLVKSFDSVLAVYEGFCNLKQVLSSSHFVIFFFTIIDC